MPKWARGRTDTTSAAVDDREPATARRIVLGTGASGARVLLFTFFQLVSVPLFLHRWSNALYGGWLIFYTIPSYLSFADLGLQSAVGASMSMHVANNRYREAAEELWAYALVLTVVLGVVGSGAVVAVDLFPLSHALHIGAMTPASSKVVGTSLVLYGALAVLSGISSAGYRAVGLFTRQLVFVTLASLADYVVLCGGMWTREKSGRPPQNLVSKAATWIRRSGRSRSLTPSTSSPPQWSMCMWVSTTSVTEARSMPAACSRWPNFPARGKFKPGSAPIPASMSMVRSPLRTTTAFSAHSSTSGGRNLSSSQAARTAGSTLWPNIDPGSDSTPSLTTITSIAPTFSA